MKVLLEIFFMDDPFFCPPPSHPSSILHSRSTTWDGRKGRRLIGKRNILKNNVSR